MFNYSSGMPLSLSMLYGVQDKFIELKVFLIATVVWFGFFLFQYNHSVSIWGILFLISMLALVAKTVHRIRSEDSEIITEKNIHFVNFFNDGKVTYNVSGKKVEDNAYHQIKFRILPAETLRSVANYWTNLEKVHFIEMDISTPSTEVKSGKYKFIYYSRRSFLLPHLYALSQQKRAAKINFVDKVKIDALKLKGQDFVTMSVRNNKNPGSYLNPPFLSNAGRITGEDGGVRFVFGLKTIQVKYENIELFAYPSLIDGFVDYELIFNGESYMFKMGEKYNRYLIPFYENKYESNFFDLS